MMSSAIPRSLRSALSGLALPALVALATLGCVPTATNLRGDFYFERGDYQQATRAYQDALRDDVHGTKPDRLLLRLSLAHLLDRTGRETDALSPRATAQASETLARLLREYPDSSHAPTARVIRELLREIALLQDRARADSERLEVLEAEADSCRQRAETLKGALDAQEERLSSAMRQNEEQAASLAELRDRLARQKKRIEELEQALNALKRIDMQRSR
jgi:TolA-binding protein